MALKEILEYAREGASHSEICEVASAALYRFRDDEPCYDYDEGPAVNFFRSIGLLPPKEGGDHA